MQKGKICKQCNREIEDGKRVIVDIVSLSWSVEKELVFHYECFKEIVKEAAWLLLML